MKPSTDLAGNFTRLAAQFEGEGGIETILAAAEVYRDIAAGLAPVLTGELRDSIQIEREGDAVLVVAKAEHAGYVEYGTTRMPGRPFMREAMGAANDRAVAAAAAKAKAKVK